MNPIDFSIYDEYQTDCFDVDDAIAEAIQILNRKGYYTLFSCSGHTDDQHYPGHAYVQFDQVMIPEEIPEGWYYEDDVNLYYQYTSMNEKELEEEIITVMAAFNEWAINLPDATI